MSARRLSLPQLALVPWLWLLIGAMAPNPSALAASTTAPETVVLLHGVMMTGHSMGRIESALEKAGYRVINLTYPSRQQGIESIAADFLPAELARHGVAGAPRLHFVTHSMGSLVVRAFLRNQRPANLGRVVMLGPPNHGSEVADKLANQEFFQWLVGVNLSDLRTVPEATPQRLGEADYELGVIAGDTSINPLFSSLMPGPNDGPVSVESAKLAGMRDFLVVRHSHTLMLWQEDVIAQVLVFLHTGRFARPAETAPARP